MNYSDFIKELKELISREPKGYDTDAVVTRIEDDIAWVHIAGGDDETPVKLTIDAHEGDTVQVRLSGGNAFLVGNQTAPPTDDTTAVQAHEVATEATVKAEQAQADIDEQKETFWHDDSGAHILGSKSGYRNDLRSDGMHIVEVSTGNEVATFTASEAQIGKTSKTHATIGEGFFKLSRYSGDFFYVGEISNAQVSDVYIGNGVQTHFTAISATVLEITNVTVDGVDASWVVIPSPKPWGVSSTIEISPAPADGSIIRIIYTLARNAYFKSFGNRKQNSAVGAYSIAEGLDVEASGAYSKAFGLGTIASGNQQVAIGRYNEEDALEERPFIIGNGTDDDERSNAFAVKWDGTVETAKGTLTAQSSTTTWQSMTASGATKTAGGFYEEGKHVYVSIQCSLTSAGAAGDNITLFTGLPRSLFYVPLEVMVANQLNGVAWINDSGELHFRPSASVTTSNVIAINGHYTSA